MGWADRAIKELQEGNHTTVKPHGNSMSGLVESGSLVTLEPIKISDLTIKDIVLCVVKGNQYLHLVKAIQDGRVLIGNNHGRINGWTSRVYGRAIKIERRSAG
jgi:hypothetical protein